MCWKNHRPTDKRNSEIKMVDFCRMSWLVTIGGFSSLLCLDRRLTMDVMLVQGLIHSNSPQLYRVCVEWSELFLSQSLFFVWIRRCALRISFSVNFSKTNCTSKQNLQSKIPGIRIVLRLCISTSTNYCSEYRPIKSIY